MRQIPRSTKGEQWSMGPARAVAYARVGGIRRGLRVAGLAVAGCGLPALPASGLLALVGYDAAPIPRRGEVRGLFAAPCRSGFAGWNKS
jgi:hypothetical protein